MAKPQTPPPAVEVASVAEGDLEVTVHYLGTIVPFTRSDISSRISGNILTIAKREGDAVRQGEVLATIDDRELADRIVAVNAEVLSTRQKQAGAQSVYETQKSIYERDVTLQKAGAISQEALDRSRAALDSAKAAAVAYEESLKGLAMNTSVARTQAGYARLARTVRRGDFQAVERAGRPRGAWETDSDHREALSVQGAGPSSPGGVGLDPPGNLGPPAKRRPANRGCRQPGLPRAGQEHAGNGGGGHEVIAVQSPVGRDGGHGPRNPAGQGVPRPGAGRGEGIPGRIGVPGPE